MMWNGRHRVSLPGAQNLAQYLAQSDMMLLKVMHEVKKIAAYLLDYLASQYDVVVTLAYDLFLLVGYWKMDQEEQEWRSLNFVVLWKRIGFLLEEMTLEAELVY